jgi:glutamate-1-semialdehyde 2,1-aminomutase
MATGTALSPLARADRVLSGGALNQLALPGGERRVIARGSGARVWDTDGREYIDHVLGSGPLILGHAHPAVVEAVRRQLERGSTFYSLNEPAIALAERIVERSPCAELVQFCNSGAEATFFAMRVARAATGRDAVLKFEGGFHGSSDYALMSLFPTGVPQYPRPEPTSGGIPGALVDEVLVSPFNDADAAGAIVERHADRLAAIIVEPVQRVIEPLPGFLPALRELASRHGIVLIFDEVVTGFRIAPGGAQQRYGVIPDLAAYGKIIGGGHPLAAVAGRADLMRLVDHRLRGRPDYVYVSGTLNGNPTAATAGLATLDVLDRPGSYDRLEAVGERMRSGLRGVFAAAGVPAQVLGVGPLFQVALSGEEIRDYRALRRADAVRLRRLAHRVLESGVYLTAEKGYLSLAHTDEDVDRVVAAFAEALAAGEPGNGEDDAR